MAGGGVVTRVASRAGRIWTFILDIALTLWVVRVPLVSIALGFVILGLAPQAADALVDVAIGDQLAEWWEMPPSVRLLILVFLLWAMPVHYSARLLLQTDQRYRATALVRGVGPRPDPPATRCGICGLLRECFTCGPPFGCIETYVPRLLGAATFLAFALAALAAERFLPTLESVGLREDVVVQLRWIAALMLMGAIVFLFYAGLRRRIAALPFFAAADRFIERNLGKVFRRLGMVAGRAANRVQASGRLYLLLVGLAVGVFLIFGPHALAENRLFPRAMALPVILGGWVPALSLVGGWGRRLRAPLITAILLLVAGIYALLGDNHTVRRLADSPAAGQTSLEEAVNLWMLKNGCAGRDVPCPRPIIVAAAGGASRAGFFTASVIGHFLDFELHKPQVSVGRDNDTSYVKAANDDGRMTAALAPRQGPALTGDKVAERFFAISGVSGGSVGALMVAAALRNSPGDSKPPPCHQPAAKLWFGGGVNTWRDCLEVLMSGDFLSATFFGLTFRDQVPLGFDDRAVMLEQSWENWFSEAMTAPDAGAATVAAANANAAAGPAPPRLPGLDGAFLQLQPRADASGSATWIPYLVLNGTSVATGQRIVTSTLKPRYRPPDGCPTGPRLPSGECVLFTHALDFHELLNGNAGTDGFFDRLQVHLFGTPAASDIPASTAALNSARFPVISPPGSIRDTSGQVIDRIVDGGYFENYGADSALELAKAMVAVAPKLRPFVLVISNDPETARIDGKAQNGAIAPNIDDVSWFPDANGPLGAVMQVRSGRGRLAVAELRTWLDTTLGSECGANSAHIQVLPQPGATRTDVAREVSMSWWLSKPVQLHLRQQLENSSSVRVATSCTEAASRDAPTNDCAVAAVWQALGGVCSTPSLRVISSEVAEPDLH
ncbi:conserved hypothetical protein [Ancylobacter novellus DSM 506]|uniref:PNPLA domain-containing protein n=1 Tax=Ancylobacter novellus (strain ATCC 8093 / DSM 506 / JCM 20403 / CCM 1077 / IAM 12100 / NBRC 12443 / NCIMB 10456) TaxID=639283 RepID=D7A051_ANCN5|nr:hypothetical protein [Ancylobacter novellus]ADH89312.1 conserved hypothetical protein [Ancylobacter novellus DSM 506]